MFNNFRYQKILWAAFAVVLLAPAASVAKDLVDADTKEVSRYVLTESGLAQYTQVTNNLAPHAKQMAGDCDDSTDAASLDDMVARVDAVPGVRAAIKSAGMTPREYIVFSLSLLQSGMAAWALDQPGGKLPSGTSMANVQFYRAHEVAIKKLGEHTKTDGCEGGEGEDHSED